MRTLRILPTLGLLACAGDPAAPQADDTSTDACPRTHAAPESEVALTYAPYVQWTGPGQARLRFETGPEDAMVPVLLDRGGDCPEEVLPTQLVETLTHYWPTPDNSLELEHPDLPGDHVLHEVVFDVAPGEVVGWTIDAGAPSPWQGTVRGSPDGEAFTAVFVGDTMAPNADGVLAGAVDAEADLYLHGGDLQYQSNPVDTWSGLSYAVAPVTATAAFHPAVGNHEHEEHDEFAQMYLRLFDGAGTAAGEDDATVVDYGGVRFLGLNSEGTLGDAAGAQVAWLTAQLEAASADPDIREVVPYFHRPVYTLAKHDPKLSLRAVIEPLFAAHGVRLVLQAHNHSYERFEVDGITWITDGGGGALLYDVDGSLADFPDEESLRVAKSQTYGHTRLTFEADGSVTLVRIDVDGAEVDRTTLPAR